MIPQFFRVSRIPKNDSITLITTRIPKFSPNVLCSGFCFVFTIVPCLQNTCRCLHVGNLSTQMNEDTLRKVFGSYGSIEEVHIVNQGSRCALERWLSRSPLCFYLLHIDWRSSECTRASHSAAEMERQYCLCQERKEASLNALSFSPSRQHRLKSRISATIEGYSIQIWDIGKNDYTRR